MSNLWEICENTSCEWVKQTVERRLRDSHAQYWSACMYDNSHCVNYRIFKHYLCLERNLIDLIKINRTILSRFRCGNHYLPIVAGRYSNTLREMRLCTLCNLQSLGDEFYYLFVCPTFRSDRKLFIGKYFIERPNTLIMDQLFNSNNVQTRLNLVKFRRKIMLRFH